MNIENFKKTVTSIASTTVKKAGEQVQITKLDLERNSIEREIEAVYAEIGRHCYTLAKTGVEFDGHVGEYCRRIDKLASRIADIENRIAAHKLERDSAEYTLRFEDDDDADVEVEFICEEVVDAETEEAVSDEELGEALDAAFETLEEKVECAADAVEEKFECAADAAEAAAEAVEEKIEKLIEE